MEGATMALFSMSEETLAEYRKNLVDEVTPHCGGEPVEAVGLFRRGGTGASFAASKLGGGLPYAAVALMRKKRSGGMPDKIILAVTPTKLYGFTWKMKGRNYRVKDEIAVWDRAGLSCSTAKAGSMTAIEIVSPAEGEKARLVGGGIQDDPWSLEVMKALGATAEEAPA
jgi:hypothetical protein